MAAILIGHGARYMWIVVVCHITGQTVFMPIDIVIGSHHDHFWLEMMQKYVYILCEASTIAGASLIQYNKWTEFALLPMRQECCVVIHQYQIEWSL